MIIKETFFSLLAKHNKGFNPKGPNHDPCGPLTETVPIKF